MRQLTISGALGAHAGVRMSRCGADGRDIADDRDITPPERALHAQESGFQEAVGQYQTGLPLETLQYAGNAYTKVPAGMVVHAEIERLLQRRRSMLESAKSRVDFAFAELLAFGTLSLRRPDGPQRASKHQLGSREPALENVWARVDCPRAFPCGLLAACAPTRRSARRRRGPGGGGS